MDEVTLEFVRRWWMLSGGFLAGVGFTLTAIFLQRAM